MKNYIKKLLNDHEQAHYSMQKGSNEWVDIKTDYEIEGDAVVGTAMHKDFSEVGEEKIIKFKNDLEVFKERVNGYAPKDEVEIEEKKVLQEKVKIGLEIYDEILKCL